MKPYFDTNSAGSLLLLVLLAWLTMEAVQFGSGSGSGGQVPPKSAAAASGSVSGPA